MNPFRAPATDKTTLSKALQTAKGALWGVALFSGIVNLLQLTVSLYMMQVFDRVLATRSMDTLMWLTLVAIVAIALLALLEGARGNIMQKIATWIEQKVAPDSFLRAMEAKLFGKPYSSEAVRDLSTARSWLSSPGALALFDVPWVPLYLGVIFLLHPIMGWMAVGGAVVLILITLANELWTAPLLKKANIATMQGHRQVEMMTRNAEVLDSMGMYRPAMEHWQRKAQEAAPLQDKAAYRAGWFSSITKFVRLALQIGILGVGCYLVLRQELTSGASIAGSILLGRALAPIEQMIGGWKGLVQARQAYQRLQAFLSQNRLRPESLPLPAPVGQVSVERLVYGPPGATAPIIKGISFMIQAGDSVALVGPSGAGKTTLARLLIGTLPPSAGSVRLDSADVSKWLREDLGQYLGYLPQDVELFEGTVFHNIARLGEAEPEHVYAAAKMAGCHEMILRLPKGYDTEVGENGQQLSGGQRQLVGLARALFGSPKFVVLDEPDSSLDGDAEMKLVQALKHLKEKGITVLLVSHRPTLMQGVEKILVMKDGQIEAFGPKQEVMNKIMGPRPVAAPSLPRSGAQS